MKKLPVKLASSNGTALTSHSSCRQLIRASGIQLAGDRPLCLEPDAVGDSVDHVRPERKRATTEDYYELLRPLLE